ncbi:MAG: TetR family transcriptional regulator [Alphaproteobacteria bacterium]|nr:TetR family transcriptional regulator [Alphaproteobacteria bacterium]
MRGIPAETRKRILAAATDLFYAKGIRAVGVDAIAAAAGVTKRTLYLHFDGKDDLIAAYLEARNEPVLAGLIKSVMRSSGGIAAQIEGLFLAFARQAGNPNWHGCPFARAVSELRETPNDAVSEIAARHKRAFEDWLAEHLASHHVAEPALVARQLMVLVDGCITQILIHRDPSYAAAAAAAAVALVERRLPD